MLQLRRSAPTRRTGAPAEARPPILARNADRPRGVRGPASHPAIQFLQLLYYSSWPSRSIQA